MSNRSKGSHWAITNNSVISTIQTLFMEIIQFSMLFKSKWAIIKARLLVVEVLKLHPEKKNWRPS